MINDKLCAVVPVSVGMLWLCSRSCVCGNAMALCACVCACVCGNAMVLFVCARVCGNAMALLLFLRVWERYGFVCMCLWERYGFVCERVSVGTLWFLCAERYGFVFFVCGNAMVMYVCLCVGTLWLCSCTSVCVCVWERYGFVCVRVCGNAMVLSVNSACVCVCVKTYTFCVLKIRLIHEASQWQTFQLSARMGSFLIYCHESFFQI